MLARLTFALLCFLVVAGVSVIASPDANAHGGYFMPPRGNPPPPPPGEPPPPPPPPPAPADEAPPSPPPPPPPPPGGGPLPTPGHGDAPKIPKTDPRAPPPTPPPGPTTPPSVAPTTPTVPTTPSAGGRRTPIRTPIRGRRAGLTSSPEGRWETWWTLNRLGLLPDRTAGAQKAVVTPSSGPAIPVEETWRKQRELVGQRHVTPLLRRLAGPESTSRDEVIASALIALAKTSHAIHDVGLLLQTVENDRASNLVRESAALALGLLARTERGSQLDSGLLDHVREVLLRVFDDGRAPLRTRAFAALSLGLLGDQPCAGPYGKDGRLVVHALWARLEKCEENQSLKVALLTALGMQPAAGVPDGVRTGLERIVTGRRALGRRWDPNERSHALTATLRLGGPAAHALLIRTLARHREHVDVRRAASMAIGELAARFTPAERGETAEVLLKALKKHRDPLTTGLGHLALGHLLGADLRAGALEVFTTHVPRELLREARSGATPTRGFSTLALGLALRDVSTSTPRVGTFLGDAGRTLLHGLVGGRGDDRMRASYAVAVGIAGIQKALPTLVEIVSDDHAAAELRGHAAVSLGQLGSNTPAVHRVLFGAIAQRRSIELRRQAALGLAFLGNRLVGGQLLKELDRGKTEQLLAQIVIALGRLGDLRAVGPLAGFARDTSRSELSQALAVVALGLLADPEPRPTLLRLTQHANYPARTDAMQEAFSIL